MSKSIQHQVPEYGIGPRSTAVDVCGRMNFHKLTNRAPLLCDVCVRLSEVGNYFSNRSKYLKLKRTVVTFVAINFPHVPAPVMRTFLISLKAILLFRGRVSAPRPHAIIMFVELSRWALGWIAIRLIDATCVLDAVQMCKLVDDWRNANSILLTQLLLHAPLDFVYYFVFTFSHRLDRDIGSAVIPRNKINCSKFTLSAVYSTQPKLNIEFWFSIFYFAGRSWFSNIGTMTQFVQYNYYMNWTVSTWNLEQK